MDQALKLPTFAIGATEADYVIVGSGLAGYTLASRIHQGNPSLRVLVIEAGIDPSGNPLVTTPMGGPLLSLDLNWTRLITVSLNPKPIIAFTRITLVKLLVEEASPTMVAGLAETRQITMSGLGLWVIPAEATQDFCRSFAGRKATSILRQTQRNTALQMSPASLPVTPNGNTDSARLFVIRGQRLASTTTLIRADLYQEYLTTLRHGEMGYGSRPLLRTVLEGYR